MAAKLLPVLLLPAAALLLFSCKQGGEPEREPSTAGAGGAGGVVRMPGSWKTVRQMKSFDASGVSGGMADMVAAGKASVGKPDVGGPTCLTVQDTATDTLQSRLDDAMKIGPEWKVVRNTFRNGQVDFAAQMDDPVQGKGHITIKGSISSIASSLVITTDATEPAPGKGHIRTTATQETARLGDC